MNKNRVKFTRRSVERARRRARGKEIPLGQAKSHVRQARESWERYAVLENCTIFSFRSAINNKIYNKLHPGRDK